MSLTGIKITVDTVLVIQIILSLAYSRMDKMRRLGFNIVISLTEFQFMTDVTLAGHIPMNLKRRRLNLFTSLEGGLLNSAIKKMPILMSMSTPLR